VCRAGLDNRVSSTLRRVRWLLHARCAWI